MLTKLFAYDIVCTYKKKVFYQMKTTCLLCSLGNDLINVNKFNHILIIYQNEHSNLRVDQTRVT